MLISLPAMLTWFFITGDESLDWDTEEKKTRRKEVKEAL